MNINLIPIYSFLHKKNQEVTKDDLLFVDEINNFLLDDDLFSLFSGILVFYSVLVQGLHF